jgi:hypothetical protein
MKTQPMENNVFKGLTTSLAIITALMVGAPALFVMMFE